MSLPPRRHFRRMLHSIPTPSHRPQIGCIPSPANALPKRLASSGQAVAPSRLIFWQCRHTWNRAATNTFRCLIGCSIGDLTTMWYLTTHHPTVAAGTAMGLSSASAPLQSASDRFPADACSKNEKVTAGITTSILLETTLLRHGTDRLPWKVAARTACGMSLVWMLAMELTENVVTLGLFSDASAMSLSSGHFWLVTGLSMVSGFAAPAPYNYWRLQRYGKGCH